MDRAMQDSSFLKQGVLFCLCSAVGHHLTHAFSVLIILSKGDTCFILLLHQRAVVEDQ